MKRGRETSADDKSGSETDEDDRVWKSGAVSCDAKSAATETCTSGWTVPLRIRRQAILAAEARTDVREGVPDPGLVDAFVFPQTYKIEALRGQPIKALRAYAYAVHERGPPDKRFGPSWDHFRASLWDVEYLSDEWFRMHPDFASASRAGVMLGLDPYTTPAEFAHNLRFGEPPETDVPRAFFKCRGLKLEPFMRRLYIKLLGGRIVIRDMPTMIDIETPYLSATSDGGVKILPPEAPSCFDDEQKRLSRDETIDRIIESKAPNGDAYLEVPARYMAQVQQAMACTGQTVCDFQSLHVNEKSGESEFVVIRVWKSEAYLNEFLRPGISLFCRRYFSGEELPSRQLNRPTPSVRTEIVFRRSQVVDLIPGGADMIRAATKAAWAEAYAKVRRSGRTTESST